MTSHSLWSCLETYPPILVRLLAHKTRSKPLSTEEIASRSGLSPYTVAVLGQSFSWDGVDVHTVRKFTQACGVDFCSFAHMKKVRDYLRNPPNWKYLRKSSEWETLYEPLIKRYQKYVNERYKL